MEQNIFNLNDKIYSNNNNILLEIVNDLQQLLNYSKDNLIIKTLGNVITKMNYIINENKKNVELIRNDISLLYNKLNKRFDNLQINNINKQELKYDDGRYVGHIVNGLAEGKGIWYGNNGDRYEGDWRNGNREGKGIYYYNNEPWKGDRYEGDWRNDKKEGKGIYYYHNGDRSMGDYYNGKPVGKHVTLTKNGEVKVNNY